jgi:hypothetical protein
MAALVVGLAFCLVAVLDAFQTIILPRRPTGRLRLTRLFYTLTWVPWSWTARRLCRSPKLREQLYSVFGPASLLLLLVLWAFLLVTGFGLLFYGQGIALNEPLKIPQFQGALGELRTDFYASGTSLFTLGLGDVQPRSLWARTLVVIEAGTGLGFVAVVIGYVPVLYGAFSHREVSIAMLDGRAGSPPTSAELLRRHAFPGGQEALATLLAEWERWSAEILESHVSYPILCYYRSQHDNQSWLSALTAVLDTCALLISVVPGQASRQAQLTFAMARHALVDLGHVFHLEEQAKEWESRGGPNRLDPPSFEKLCRKLAASGMQLCGDTESPGRLTALRALYEPHAAAIAEYLGMTLPNWVPEPLAKDQWKTVETVRSQAVAVLKDSVVSDRSTALQSHRDDH